MTDAVTVRTEQRGAVLILTIDRPQVRNAMDHYTLLTLTRMLTTAGTDPSVRVLILTAADERAFSAGLDLKAMAEHGVPDPATSPLNLLRFGGYAKPVVAAVNGAAFGGGFELALACDLRVAADTAVFALPEVSRGVAASEGGTDLPTQLPIGIALEIGLTGVPIPASRALALGLVNAVVPAADLLATALELAGRIAEHSPAAVAATKQLMYQSITAERGESLARNREVTSALLAGPDAREGVAAFLAKRSPRWADPA